MIDVSGREGVIALLRLGARRSIPIIVQRRPLWEALQERRYSPVESLGKGSIPTVVDQQD
ncbi:hypothetical protein [Novosphingobium guangzhouense]|uniref:Uncharacterized protein n=1 Tax=Novosphingobium guangzhouense TaxID=1850347 RepID=A0A2K2G6B3_9SPHN|nr:hypothetical protein [Novosphingobium guangzhouense]PNU06518.1 hypothetical protein A8V01_02975 [Novosphingobium guangzhouense]